MLPSDKCHSCYFETCSLMFMGFYSKSKVMIQIIMGVLKVRNIRWPWITIC